MLSPAPHLENCVAPDPDLLVGLVTDSGVVARDVRAALESSAVDVVRMSTDTEQNEGSFPGQRLDAVLLHAGEDGAHREAAVDEVRRQMPETPILALWDAPRVGDDRRAAKLTLEGVVLLADLHIALVPAVLAVTSGLFCLPRALRPQRRGENLSMREKQILGMVVMGFTNAQIASRLFLAESTVKSHLSSAYEKLGVRSRKDAAALILDPSVGLDRGILSISAV